ncbi:hypothetical protein KIN20_010480 [Parelaphostrongylus tenuis]|uniref:Potassium channel domain-containing protein n=1 Tax=Parelaphostrongylus tenuis TaxID=148309 RepID=A0AAD5MTG3_PARTN|nr:hypothetical protein KIN20_010480 [Parelaphostrongylus tenuis]
MADAFSHISEESEDANSVAPEAAATQIATSTANAGSNPTPSTIKNQESKDQSSPKVQHPPEVVKGSVIPQRSGIRSISMSEGSDDHYAQRSRNLHRVHPKLDKRRSSEFPSNIDRPTEISSDEEVIERYYQKNRARASSVQSRTSDVLRKNSTRRHPIFPRHGMQPEVVMPSPKVRERKNFTKSFYWLVANHNKIGFRHICMLLLVLIYTLLGALLFYLIESNYEKNIVVIRKKALDGTILRIATEVAHKVNNPNVTVSVKLMEEYIKGAYVTLLEQESAYKGSTFYKSEDPYYNYKWTFGSAFFFAMNVYTTTGYGAIAPESVAGRSCVIVYGFLFVPLTLVVIRDLGQWALVHITKIYARLLIMFRRARGLEETKEDEMISLPIKFCLGVMFSYLMLTSLFIYEYDAVSGPPGSGMDFFHSFYFSFISMSTIGLGDIMPNNVTFAPIITVIFFFGMPIMKVVNRSTYVCLENGVFGTLTVLENRLDSCCTGVQPTDTEAQPAPHRPSIHRLPSESVEAVGDSSGEEAEADQFLNNFTIRSIATFMRSHSDVYGGDFGRVNLRRSDLLPQNTDGARSMSVSSGNH